MGGGHPGAYGETRKGLSKLIKNFERIRRCIKTHQKSIRKISQKLSQIEQKYRLLFANNSHVVFLLLMQNKSQSYLRKRQKRYQITVSKDDS